MAGIEINPKSVLRTAGGGSGGGPSVQNSFGRGYNPLAVAQNHQNATQIPGSDSVAVLASNMRGYNTRSQPYVSATQTLPRSSVDPILSHNLTQTLPSRSSNQKMESQHQQYLKQPSSQQQLLSGQLMTSQQLLSGQPMISQQLLSSGQPMTSQHQLSGQSMTSQHQQLMSQQLLSGQPMTSQQLLQQQILLRQLKPGVRPPPPGSKQLPQSTAMLSGDTVSAPTRNSKAILPPPSVTDSGKPAKPSPKQAALNGNQQLKQQPQAAPNGNQQLQSTTAAAMSSQQQLQHTAVAGNMSPLHHLTAASKMGQMSAAAVQRQSSSPSAVQQQQSTAHLMNSGNNQQGGIGFNGGAAAQIQKQNLKNAQQQQMAMNGVKQQQLQHTAVASQQQLQQQQQLALQQQELELLLEQQRLVAAEEDLMAKLHGVRLDQAQAQTGTGGTGSGGGGGTSDRTYMNVQPVAVIGRGGKILNQPELSGASIPGKVSSSGRKAPAIPKSQEVKHKVEPLYSTILQCSAQDTNKMQGMHVFDDGVYANYAPASLYSNYSNYSELEALRSTDSQCSADEEPTEGLPSLDTDSPVSSSYSELRQAALLGGQQQRITFNGDGSIYEPVLPPKGVPGPNSIHFKSLSGGSTDSDYFGSCVKCARKIVGDGSGCSAMGRLYHVQCFTCTQCGMVLQGLPFYAVEGSPLCEADYLNTLEKCCKCLQPILDRILRATGKPYHPNCFTCVACNKSLDGIPFTVDATNQIHCIEDFHKRFAPRCSVCKDPIMPTPGEEETVRVVALDRSFHINCYRCVDCNLLLSSDEEGRGCYPLDDTVLCRQCNTTRIQKLTSSMTQE